MINQIEITPNRPRVFVSSTIYDFRDLRSALKFHLEELGYEVMLSEFNDFRKDLDQNSYVSCLKLIDDCQYFILFVGGRVGGWYDVSKKISITQMEYRRAYERLKEGRLKLVVFVRQEVWDIREDRKALELFLNDQVGKEAGLSHTAIQAIANHSGRLVTDAEFVFEFIKEIGRLGEMKFALANNERLPIGNWIHRFTTFRDVVDALRVEFRASTGMKKAAVIANLKAELLDNLQVLFTKSGKNGAIPFYTWAGYARQQLTGGLNDSSAYDGKYLVWLGLFGLMGVSVGLSLRTASLDEAINSGEFLDFDIASDAYYVGSLQQCMIDLRNHIEQLRRNEELFNAEKRIRLMEDLKVFKNETNVVKSNSDLVVVFSAHDIQANIVELARAIYRTLDGDTGATHELQIYSSSPFAVENERIAKERPSVAEIRDWLLREKGDRRDP